MQRFLVLFTVGQEQALISRLRDLGIRLRERYEAFLLIEANEAAVEPLKADFVVQDVASLCRVRGGGGVIDTSRTRIDKHGRTQPHPDYDEATDSVPRGPHHYLVQFIGPVKPEWLKAVRRAGGEPRDPRGACTYVVRATRRAIRAIAGQDPVEWVGHLPYGDRIAESARIAAAEAGPPPPGPRLAGEFTVEFFTSDNLTAAIKAVQGLGFEILTTDPDATLMIVRAAAGGPPPIQELAKVHGVRQISQRVLPQVSNNIAVRLMGTARAMGAGGAVGGAGLGLSGAGERVAVCDSGLDRGSPGETHPDLAGRVDAILPYPAGADVRDGSSGHGTHVAGSVLGSGSASPSDGAPIRGPAYRARLVFQAVEGDPVGNQPPLVAATVLAGIPENIYPLLENAYDRGAQIHVNAWNTRHEGVYGEYDARCRSLDRFVWDHPDFCVVTAAGNINQPGDLDGDAPRVQAPGTAKNCITVGASESRRRQFRISYGQGNPGAFGTSHYADTPIARDPDQLAPLSRRGPTADGRHKPDVVAPGTYILSTRSGAIPASTPPAAQWARFSRKPRSYMFSGGTSQAAALVGGAVALLREYFRTTRGVPAPTAALLKAALVAGATRLPGIGAAGDVVDDRQGYGRVNLDAVLAPPGATMQFVEVAPGLSNGTPPYALAVQVRSERAPLRVVLAYSDFPGEDEGNALNLLVTAPAGGRPLMGNDGANGSGSPDALNNVEVVHVQRPTPGPWQVQVSAFSVPHPPQAFALVYLADL